MRKSLKATKKQVSKRSNTSVGMDKQLNTVNDMSHQRGCLVKLFLRYCHDP